MMILLHEAMNVSKDIRTARPIEGGILPCRERSGVGIMNIKVYCLPRQVPFFAMPWYLDIVLPVEGRFSICHRSLSRLVILLWDNLPCDHKKVAMFTSFVNENNQIYQMCNVVEVLTAEPFIMVLFMCCHMVCKF